MSALSRANHHSDFTKTTLGISHLQRDTETVKVRMAAIQYAFDPLLPSEEFDVSGPELLPHFDRSHQVGDHDVTGRLRHHPLVDVGQPLETYRFGVVGDDTARIWTRDAAAEAVDDTHLASDAGSLRFNVTEWLGCVVEVAVPLNDDDSAEELSGDPSVNDLRVFGALTATF